MTQQQAVDQSVHWWNILIKGMIAIHSTVCSCGLASWTISCHSTSCIDTIAMLVPCPSGMCRHALAAMLVWDATNKCMASQHESLQPLNTRTGLAKCSFYRNTYYFWLAALHCDFITQWMLCMSKVSVEVNSLILIWHSLAVVTPKDSVQSDWLCGSRPIAQRLLACLLYDWNGRSLTCMPKMGPGPHCHWSLKHRLQLIQVNPHGLAVQFECGLLWLQLHSKVTVIPLWISVIQLEASNQTFKFTWSICTTKQLAVLPHLLSSLTHSDSSFFLPAACCAHLWPAESWERRRVLTHWQWEADQLLWAHMLAVEQQLKQHVQEPLSCSSNSPTSHPCCTLSSADWTNTNVSKQLLSLSSTCRLIDSSQHGSSTLDDNWADAHTVALLHCWTVGHLIIEILFQLVFWQEHMCMWWCSCRHSASGTTCFRTDCKTISQWVPNPILQHGGFLCGHHTPNVPGGIQHCLLHFRSLPVAVVMFVDCDQDDRVSSLPAITSEGYQ